MARLFAFLSSLTAYLVAVTATAIPISGCDLTGVTIDDLPPSLPPPTSPLSFVTIALGTQNYTCTDAGTYTSAGAVAQMFDISCLIRTPVADALPDLLWAVWQNAPSFLTTQAIIKFVLPTNTPLALGQHYFIPNPITGQGISPKWDLTSQGPYKGNPDAYVVGARAGGAPAPVPTRDVDWLALNAIQGSLATQVYRTDTRGGLAPASCTPGATAAIKYVSKYWFFGGSIKQ
ncbi:hypothetical protein BKA70DRAFT_1455536 [Coprinopsis sp. MPI-PUGE-AT-0042]|nr:hypothetical protein BKA70DRAFT_1455536 [Coprinopsis sp. MPI-PUGE-AT-0042]